MPAHKKGLTCGFALRMNDHERSLMEAVVTEYADFDIKISLNDAARLLIRRGAAPCPPDQKSARALITGHWAECDRCDQSAIRCPEGKRLKDAYDHLAPLLTRRPARMLPPPPGVTRQS